MVNLQLTTGKAIKNRYKPCKTNNMAITSPNFKPQAANDDISPMNPRVIEEAHQRISPYIARTPLMRSNLLNDFLGHDITFKVEGFQRTGSFKIRGAINTILSLKENGDLPHKVVAFSSGNHAQAIAWSANRLGIKSTIFLPDFTSKIKQQATKSYGGEIILTETRQLAEAGAKEMVAKEGAYYLPPFDNDMVIAGQGTSAYEAYREGVTPDAVFATCGGGGWLSGTLLATKLLSPQTKVFGAEPLNANDAARSYRDGKIFSFDKSPDTIADGGRALCVSPRTFQYISQADDIIEVTEDEIIYWTQWLTHLLKTTVEPTSAVAMAAAHKWLKTAKQKQKLLVMLSGGNIDPLTQNKIWAQNHLENLPKL